MDELESVGSRAACNGFRKSGKKQKQRALMNVKNHYGRGRKAIVEYSKASRKKSQKKVYT